ncbi:MAG: CRTAC1 family protein, partial [Myxococcales bacterium]|nr:CRTAC1 family protein [Myxococcales bacterium]
NDGQGHFQLGPEDSGLRRVGDADIVAGATFVDADRDGNIDLWVGQHNYAPAGTNDTIFKQDYLYKGDGAGRFSDITAQAGLTTVDWENLDDVDMGLAHSRAWSSLACDLNDDGAPELLAASYGRAPNHLWQGSLTGDGALSFTNRSVVSGYAYDDDFTWQDNEFARCYCQRFSFAEGCDEVGPPRITCSSQNWSHTTDRRPFRLGGNSGTTVCADVNNDGAMDLLTTEITHWWAGSGADQSELLLNTGEAEVRFTRPGQAATGLTRTHSGVAWDQGDMTAAVFDFDNDGWPDVYIGASDYAGNHGLLFHQTEAGKFEAVPITEGIDHHRSHGIGVADFDGDGDLDLVLGHSRARCDATLPDDCYPTRQVRMFENTYGQGGNWVQLDLQGGEGTNRSAIGARVEVSAGGVTQTQEVGGGHGHYGIQHQRVLHFGLGAACEAEVTVRWPDRSLTTQTFRVVAGHRFKVVQGQDPSLAQ